MGTRESAGLAGRALPVAVLTGVLAFVYLRLFRAYGLNVEDEGTLLYQVVRTARGELPYVDFATGYTPGFFALNAWLWRVAGDLGTYRAILTAVHAATAAGLAFLVARLARPSLALVLPWLYLSFIPVFPGQFCAFNVPYPAWFASLGWLATALCMLAFLQRRDRRWLVCAGIAAALTLAMKPNAGVFAIAAAVSVLLLIRDPDRSGGVGSAVLWMVLWLGILGGVWGVFGFTRVPIELVVFLLPVLAAMMALVTMSRVRRGDLLGDVARVLVPCGVLSLPWMVFFLARLGVDGFMREVLLLGSNAAALYYISYPGFEMWAMALTVVTVSFAVGGWFVAQRRLRPQPVLGLIAVSLGLVAITVPWLGLLPEGIVWSIVSQLQATGFALTLAAHVAGVVWLWFRGRRPQNAAPAAVLLFGLFMHLQLYPRTDFMHLLMAAPLSLVFAGYLLERVYDSWERGCAEAGAPRLGRLVSATTTLALVGTVALVATPARWAISSSEHFVLPFAAFPTGLEEAGAADLRGLGAAATDLARLVPPGGASVGFPAAAAVLLLSDTINPLPHDYFYPGRPDHREEAEMLDRLVADPPLALVAMNSGFTYFEAAPAYYFLLRRFVRDHYALAARHGRYDVLARHGVLPAGPDAASPYAELPALGVRVPGPLAESAEALVPAATSRDATLRRAAVTMMLDTLGGDTDPGLEHYVRPDDLDRRQRILLLRAMRDLRDYRAASYLFAESAADDPRVVREALGAMHVTRAQMIARRHLWSGPSDAIVLPDREGLRAGVRLVLADADAAPRAVAFAAELALELRDAGSVPALRDRWRAATQLAAAVQSDRVEPPTGPETVASVAAALTELAPMGIACELVPLLARPQSAILEVVPTLLVHLAESEGALGLEARECVRRALAVPGPTRAEVIWVAAAFGGADFRAEITSALAATDIPTRRAAAWALGDAEHLPETRRLLKRMATEDPDPIARRLASEAARKHYLE